jgi:hypothetical protein
MIPYPRGDIVRSKRLKALEIYGPLTLAAHIPSRTLTRPERTFASQHRRGMIGGAARRLRVDALKPQRPQIQFVDERVDHSHRIIFGYVIVEELGKQNALRSVLALNKALLKNPDSILQDSNPTNVFTQPAPFCDIPGCRSWPPGSRAARWRNADRITAAVARPWIVDHHDTIGNHCGQGSRWEGPESAAAMLEVRRGPRRDA